MLATSYQIMPKRQKKTRLPHDPSTIKVHNALKKLGFVLDHEGRKHTIFVDPENQNRSISIPRHPTTKKNLLLGLLKAVGISERSFMAKY